MTSSWYLPALMEGLHTRVENELRTARQSIGNQTAKGDASEKVWKQLFDTYLPKRYAADKATVCDSLGHFSDEIDVVLYDRQYTPLIFEQHGTIVVPAESVYAVFEAKQEINANFVNYAQKKVASVRGLHRTSAEIQTIGGLCTATPQPILGGFLAFESGWASRPIDPYLSPALAVDQSTGRLDMGCIATYGTFGCDGDNCTTFIPHNKSATCFLLKLITRLQRIGTAPAIDLSAYAKWLTS